ncbi:hypothetical protein AGMMS49545_22910 [Betaproteobacteria bacterium]|nr:hypothetical protein AGMMS49545_22910 [Betaproteobacteria bacterium]
MQIMKNSFGMEFVLIPAGSFMMGSDDRDPWAEKIEKPRHRVTISRSFWLGRYPVTMGDSARVEDGSSRNSEPGWQCPVKTTWYGVQNFIETLNAREDTAAYRLPTEAE